MTDNRMVQALQNEAAHLHTRANEQAQCGNYTLSSMLHIQAETMDQAVSIATSNACNHDDEVMVYGCGDCGKNHPFWACHGPTETVNS